MKKSLLSNKLSFLAGVFVFVFCVNAVTAQRHMPRFEQIDVQHYAFHLKLSDETDIIEGKADVVVKFLKEGDSFILDLAAIQTTGIGMEVSEILENGKPVPFVHEEESLMIRPADEVVAGAVRSYTITYSGEPSDGLIISKNKFGDRTFFGDNWPDRAHYWLPVVDHPSDKATVEFLVNAPDHYQVVATGRQIEETNLEGGYKFTHYKSEVPMPPKVMVIGVARFAVQLAGFSHGTPVTSWVYPQNREEGFGDYGLAVQVLDYYTERIGTYPNEKLANVQSKTRYGGMENAGNIFYYENSVTGNKDHEALIAHEIVHQWFGNSASELSWHHIWLSEGFATYLTNLYMEDTHGEAIMMERMQQERNQVTRFARRNMVPVVNPKIEDYNQLLNPNSYQKGGWVLHMLRHKLGKEVFWKGIQAYYEKFKLSNALTSDFQAVMEDVSGQNLESFFEQWIFRPGQPVLRKSWKQENGNLEIEITQTQPKPFDFSLEIGLNYEDGSTAIETVTLGAKKKTFSIKTDKKVREVILDPNVKLLFEEQ
ncbi:MAG: M1 family peptidase [Bacteroidetes bacterium]|nr:MAG: M1 family peptidase [Bacteroidota bacterium]